MCIYRFFSSLGVIGLKGGQRFVMTIVLIEFDEAYFTGMWGVRELGDIIHVHRNVA